MFVFTIALNANAAKVSYVWYSLESHQSSTGIWHSIKSQENYTLNWIQLIMYEGYSILNGREW